MRTEASSSGACGGDYSGDGYSMVTDVGKCKSSCGYCASSGRTSYSHGLLAHSLTVEDYQELLDRGWRRSGCFLYKPDMAKTCCPSYTIRLNAGDFVPSKDQRRVSRRMQRFLEGVFDIRGEMKCRDESSSGQKPECRGVLKSAVNDSSSSEKNNNEERLIQFLSATLDDVIHTVIKHWESFRNIELPKSSVKKVFPAKRKLLSQGSENLLYTSSISFQIAAALKRSSNSQSELVSSDKKDEVVGPCRKNKGFVEESAEAIAQKLAEYLKHPEWNLDLSIKSCRGYINFYSSIPQTYSDKSSNSNASLRSYSKGSNLKNCSENRIPGGRRLEVRLKRSSFDPEEYALYRKYQIMVHRDSADRVTENMYKRFLVDTPLIFVPSANEGTVQFGSFHQQYLIDGRLVAVGVVDILPKCLSSKYLFWDPDYSFLSLGKYSAIHEIAWVKEKQTFCPSLCYYYLGFYIHSCKKMRYKADYHPSELLCPLRYEWVPFLIAKPLLDMKKYVILSDFFNSRDASLSQADFTEDPMKHDHNGFEEEYLNDIFMGGDEDTMNLESGNSDEEPESVSVGPHNDEEYDDLGNVLVGIQDTRMRFEELKEKMTPEQAHYFISQLRRYVRAVGTDLSTRLVYSF